VDGQVDWPTGWSGQALKTNKKMENNSFHQNGYDTASQFLYMCCFFWLSGFFGFTDFVEVGCASC